MYESSTVKSKQPGPSEASEAVHLQGGLALVHFGLVNNQFLCGEGKNSISLVGLYTPSVL